MLWSAAALAFCEVSLPAVGDGLPNVGCADASEATANKAAPIRQVMLLIQVSCFIANISLRTKSLSPISSLLLRGLPRSGRPGVSAVIGIESGHDFVRVPLHECKRHSLDVGARIGARSRLPVGNQAAIGTVQGEGHAHRDLVDRNDWV